MFPWALNKIVGEYVFRHSIALKESFLTIEVIVQVPSNGCSLVFVSIEFRFKGLAQQGTLNLLLWRRPSFYGFRMSS